MLHVPKEIGHKNLKTSIFRIDLISALNSLILCLQAKVLVHSNSLFSYYYFEKYDNIILSYFKNGSTQFKFE